MSKARMLAGGLVEPGAGVPGAVIAYVAVSGGTQGSRLFRVEGPSSMPGVEELPSATTIDLGRFDRDAQELLAPALTAIEERGGRGAITRPSPAWVCSVVRAYLRSAEGLEVD
ncbi:hypothetical protein [Chondromyces apiculatus]|uniref:Uncharacterized protein n=1 Tax=Chondromyces apiculatus DSM 436 TaxID=1192034 RepID=A0A017T600_9BACT|nr:hypothetical protein [Chondromyces apiculatus]EYF04220.1 Hypothetical protein CAP_4697 [Chondromyces apiculatus DSM 436]